MAKVLGMGNALVDIMTMLKDDSLLDKFNLPKGSMQLVDREFSENINNATDYLEKKIASGGSAANTIHGLAALGIETAFIGKVGSDPFGRFFSDDMKKNKIVPILLEGKQATGKAMALITPDSERTFATYLGAAVELDPSDITEDLFHGYDYFHIEGYLVQNHELIEKAVQLAKQNGLRISLDMASYNIVEQNLNFLTRILKTYIDIVFANEEEARAFTGKIPEAAIIEFAGHCEIAIVKTGKNGSLVRKGSEMHGIQPIAANSIDTTGAGDLYAAGFIFGLIKGYPLNKCGDLGSLLAGKTIEVIGPKMDSEKWKQVKRMISNY
jgi:sugar/nucleoside kinase (ribokinase family)